MNWHIVADSSCDLFNLPECPPDADFSTVPFAITIGDKTYIDGEDMPVAEMLDANEQHGVSAHTACPSAQDWIERFSAPGPVIAFTISSELSGSYNSACAAKQMILEKEPDKQIAIIDTRATGPETVLLIRKVCGLIREGLSVKSIEKKLFEAAEKTHILFALASYHNLVRAGRVSRIVGLIATGLHLWGIGMGSDEGKIEMCCKARGSQKMISAMTEEIKRIGLSGKEIVISHCQNLEAALGLKEKLCEMVKDLKVDIIPTRGLDSFYAERKGLIVGF
ncbi:MAG: DegV family protein [Clostridia bacterium]|nr:DegV family protein [Clostridia bacterium]